MVARKKPAPDIYELILTMLRVSSAAGSVAFEEFGQRVSWRRKRSVIYTVVTPTRWTAAQSFPGADLLLPSLGDPDQPLDTANAAKIGAPYLELATLEKLRSAISPALTLSKAGS